MRWGSQLCIDAVKGGADGLVVTRDTDSLLDLDRVAVMPGAFVARFEAKPARRLARQDRD